MIDLSAGKRRYRLFWGIVTIAVLIGLCSSCLSSPAIETSAIDNLIAEATTRESDGDFASAIEIYLDGLVKFPNAPRLLYNLAIVYAKSGAYHDSLTVLERLNGITNHTNTKYLHALAGIASYSGNLEIAQECWKTVLEIDPMDFDSRERLVDSFIESEMFEDAYYYALQAYELHHFQSWVFEKLTLLEHETGRGSGASWKLLADSLI
jgi:tetratricopeptide (TPR) repeat protein